MSQDKQTIGLFDFSQLRRKNEEYNTTSSKNSTGSHNVDLDLESNEQIMKSFKELRDKLKITTRENQCLREQMSSMQVQIRQLHDSQKNLMTINHQLKQRNMQIQQAGDELKKRIIYMKDDLSQFQILKGEHEFLKGNFLEIKAKNEVLQEQKKKIIEISIEEKMNIEQKLDKLIFKKQSDDKYLAELEADLCRAKQANLKLQNQLKKLEIKYDEELFNKKWSKQNFEKEHYEKKNQELQAELTDLKSKLRRQKEKRADLQKRLLQLQQMTGLCNVKAEAYEGEVELMSKKVKKMEKRVSQAKQSANKMAEEKINYEEKFNKSVQICEELVNRVKRELMGDVVELAKTTEYRLNKLKQCKQVDKIDFSKTVQRLSNPHKKQKSQKKLRQSVQKQNPAGTKQDYSFKYLESNAQTGRILFESSNNQSKRDTLKSKNGDNITQTPSDKTESNDLQVQNIELKVRKERQQMEKKLKEKMLYRKIELSNSPNKGKLRQEYLKLIFDK